MPSTGIAGSYGRFTPSFLRNFHTAFHNGCVSLHSHQRCRKFPFLHMLYSIYSLWVFCFLVSFLMLAILTGVRCYLIVILICISLIMGDIEHLFMCLLAICMSSLETCLFMSSVHFWLDYLFFWYSAVWASCLYIFEINPLPLASFAIICSNSVGCLFILCIVSFAVQKL